MSHVAHKSAPYGIKKCATWYQKMRHVVSKNAPRGIKKCAMWRKKRAIWHLPFPYKYGIFLRRLLCN